MKAADIVICGAGIAGISAAYQLAVKQGVKNVLLVDERAPLSLTSDKSSECYRNWWPGPDDAMVTFMNRSIDLMEERARESDNRFHLNRRGYLYVTGDSAHLADFKRFAQESASLGAGALRVHAGQPGEPAYFPAPVDGFEKQPTGADLILDPALIRQYFPYLSEKTVAVLHARRCGWLSGQQLGMYLLEQAREYGVRFLSGRVTGVDVQNGAVTGVQLADGSQIATGCLVDAAGPLVGQVAKLMGVDLPIFSELHIKMSVKDELGVVPRDTPVVIWNDAQALAWSAEERELLAESDETRGLLNMLPAGAHFRPDGGIKSHMVMLLWAYHTVPVEPVWPLESDPFFPQVVLRGLVTMMPSLAKYLDHLPKPVIDGGYYTKTRENRLLVGPLPVRGAYVIGALSGYGIMASCAAGELLAAHITGSSLPRYAPAFALERYQDPAYQKLLQGWEATGQL